MKAKKTPYLYIILSFLGVILIGTFIFMLPISTVTPDGLSLVDALFMSTSSVCVTGLSVIPNVGTTFSTFGKIVMAILIEIGGLSILTIASFFLSILGRKLGMSGTLLMREALNQHTASEVKPLIKKIIQMAIIVQMIGAIINLFVFIPYYGVSEGIGVSVFHAISSFNNAGLDIFGYDTSMSVFKDNILLNINTMVLIIIGGIGFVVINDVFKKHNFSKLSLHSKIVLLMTAILIPLGFILMKLLNYDNMSWLQALFTSITMRTAGFTTYNIADLSNGSYLLALVFMFIGASPCSTGGGIKTTTIFIIIITLFSMSRGKKPTIFRRTISLRATLKAFALLTLSLTSVLVATIILNVVETDMSFHDLLFEAVSAFGTVGLSMGITADLSLLSKIIITVTMFLGRIGPITIINIWNNNWLKNTKEEVQYIEEKVIVG